MKALLLFCILAAAPAESVKVQPGETLWKIATRELGNGARWQEIAEFNALTPPYNIAAGQTLKIPRPGARIPATRPAERAPDRPQGEAKKMTPPIEPAADVEPAAVEASPSAPPLSWDSLLDNDNTSDFGTPISADALVAVALERNIPLLSGRLAPLTADADLLKARAAFDPSLSFTTSRQEDRVSTFGAAPPARTFATSYSNSLSGKIPLSTQYQITTSMKRTAVDPGGTGINPSYSNSAALQLTQPLLKGSGREIATAPVEIARLSSSASRETLRRLAERTIAQVENAYWELARAEAAERIARNSLAVAEFLRRRNEELLARGLVAQIDVITARRGEATRKATLLSAEKSRLDAAEALVFLVYGPTALSQLRSGTKLIATVAGDLPSPDLAALDAVESRAIDARRDVIAARRDLDATMVSLRVAKNSLLPDLSLTGTYTNAGTTNDARFSYSNRMGDVAKPSWFAGMTFTIPIGNNSAQADHRKALVTLEQKRLAVIEAENKVRSEIRVAIRGVRTGRARLESTEEAAALARQQLDGEKKRMELGLTDSYRLLQVEEDAAQAELSAAQSRSDYATAVTNYRLAAGEIVRSTLPEALFSDLIQF